MLGMSQWSSPPAPDKTALIRALEEQARRGGKLEAAAHEDTVRSWQERFRLKTFGPPVELDVSDYLLIGIGLVVAVGLVLMYLI
jgi:hypothetical protein